MCVILDDMVGPVERIAIVEALMLRTKLPDLSLREGSAFVARVASRGEQGKASLVVAGELISANVPEEVRQGQTLRLTVAEVTPERITLKMDPLTPPPLAPPPPPAPLRVTVEERPGDRAGGRAGGESAVTLTYETPALGRVRVRVTTAPGAVAATIQVPAAVLAAAQARAPQLREDLAARTGRASAVHVVPGSVDVRA
jgi:hypothetical protein